MFSANLKRLRQAAGLTQESFAGKAGVPVATVRNWEQGRREPKLAQLSRLAAVLGVGVEELVSEAPAAKGRRPRKRKA